MKKGVLLFFGLYLIGSMAAAQTGTLQIYCEPGINIYIDNQYKGKSNTEMAGLLIEDLPIGVISVRAVKTGYASQTSEVSISSDSISEIKIEMMHDDENAEWVSGLEFHMGTFGLFNVNNSFTKANYSFGLSPFLDYQFHPFFAVGFELMSMWGKPATLDDPRLILCSNVRFSGIFNAFDKINVNVMLASGFTWWPENAAPAYLTPTLNESRMGWDFRASAGIDYCFSRKIALGLNFGYWASSSSSDDIIWITHDTMLLSVGSKFRF